MAYTTEERRLLWLSVAELSAGRVRRLVEALGSAEALWQAFPEHGHKLFEAASHRALSQLRDEARLDEFCSRIDKCGATVLFLHSDDYPALLRQVDEPPYWLYCKGDLQALTRPCVAVVGTREPTLYGRSMAREMGLGLAEAGVCVVSGLARGVDACAHRGALDARGRTVAVLGNGVERPYPVENARLYEDILRGGGLLLSEYAPGSEPKGYHFPYRNRIISGLSQAVVFVEGRIRSGGMHTVSAALEQGREVFAMPGRANTLMSEGPHQIIREGARMVTCARDVLEDLGLQEITVRRAESGPPPGLTAPQAEILTALAREPMTMDELQPYVSLPAATLQTELGLMEISGFVKRGAGNRYARSNA